MTDQQQSPLNQPSSQDPKQRAAEAMLRMARDLQSKGQVFEAKDLYIHVLEDYPDTQQSVAAANALVALAESLERQGMPRQALELYHQLEELQ